ncbi:MAG: hypothetical protein H8E16_01895 [Flavobacteriales bacterium]|nr:hypothetical protein [Flavobacteriales bacterium]
MANNKLHGYNPDPSKEVDGNRLDRFNPSEFRKGMDYELIAVGCSRLAESTEDERRKATEKVIGNLTEHGGYYTSLITYETQFRNTDKKPSFKQWLAEQGEYKMQEVNYKYKNDKMSEPKVKSQEVSTKADIKMDKLKESITAEIRNILFEVKGKEAEKVNKADAQKEKDDDKASITTAKGKAKKLASLEKEVDKLNIEKNKLKDSQKAPLAKYKDGKMSSSEYTVATKESVKRIKEIITRLKEIEIEKDEITLSEKVGRREVAKTMMEKDTHMEILNIIKEAGVNLREGADGIKMYYEIAKTAYQEGFMAGVNKN